MSMQPLLIELGTEELPVKALPGLAQAFSMKILAISGSARRLSTNTALLLSLIHI